MIDVTPPLLAGFEKPAIIRSAADIVVPSVLPGMAPNVVGGGGALALTEKGRGVAGGALSLTLNYSTVGGGSAPSAGDLVIWVLRHDHSDATNQFVDLTATGWTYATLNLGGGIFVACYTKVVVASDISSPPTAVSGVDSGAGGFWVAYAVTGAISALTVNDLSGSNGNASAPTNIVINASAGVGPLVLAGLGSGTAGASITWSGATSDNSVTGTNVTATLDIIGRYKLYAAGAGNDVTMSKPDEGASNALAGCYVKVS